MNNACFSRLRWPAALCCWLTLLLLAGCVQSPREPTHGNLRNWGYVGQGVARGSQPDAQGFACLKSQGYTNIVKLNTEREGTDAPAKALGMRVTYVPITTRQQIFGPCQPQLRIALINLVPGTYVHCSHGMNRTGSAIILFRRQQGWSEAWAEWEADVYGWDSTFWALKRETRNFKR